uniref:RNase NYN domain-containing protein n=1 Tax=Panagrolaimus superbus TaxID=310955 RepID=A0A914Y345_9BILA
MSPPHSPQLHRLIIIDGFNVMHGFKNLIDGLHQDSRMNAMILLPLFRIFSNSGFIVRIALKRLPEPFEVDHMYIIQELNKVQACIYPKEDFREADDCMMLQIAERYGAKIISNDAFTNHPEYQFVAQKYTIKYKKTPNPEFSFDQLQHGLIFENKFTMNILSDDLYCSPDDPDYKKVRKSHDAFWRLTIIDNKILDLLWNYVHCGICSQIGFKIPSNIKFMNDNESCPPKFEVFKYRNLL